jgi:tetratricopeptide (TPR) repeat protein
MQRRLPGWWLPPLALLLAGAAPELSPEELVRQGNAAFDREEFAAAVDFYTKAEERITDPGLTAYNKATALYRLHRFDEAARHYEHCLDEATGARRATLLYDLGDCRLQQSQGTNAERLRHAIDCFAQALRQDGLADQLRDDARHNLELAKLLWLKARQSPAKPDGSDQPPPKDPPKSPNDKQPPEPKNSADPGPGTKVDPLVGTGAEPDSVKGQKTPISTDKQAPGKGPLPPIPDTAERVPMAPEDAATHLQRAAERVLRERRLHQQRSAPAPSRVIPDY